MQKILELVYDYLRDCDGEGPRDVVRGASRWACEHGSLTSGMSIEDMIEISDRYISEEGWPADSKFRCVEDALEYMASMKIVHDFESSVESVIDEAGDFERVVTRLPSDTPPDAVIDHPTSSADVLVFVDGDGEPTALSQHEIGSGKIWFDVTEEVRDQIMDHPLLCLEIAASRGDGEEHEE